MRHASAYLWIALGSALGGMARYAVSEYVVRRAGESFPWGTLVVNVTGSFLIGLLAASIRADSPHAASLNTRLFLTTGVCGGYTTFSAFSLQTLALLQKGAIAAATINIALSVALCLAAVALGALLATATR